MPLDNTPPYEVEHLTYNLITFSLFHLWQIVKTLNLIFKDFCGGFFLRMGFTIELVDAALYGK